MVYIGDTEKAGNSAVSGGNAGVELSRRFSVAPMMDWTTPHFRYLARILSKRALLYTEMVTTGALIHGDTERFLR
ncbi:MAG: tRNA-dihydrouridine synthase, partial [Pseudomonadota bacterium]|nr:tRNA-dihydrouridine synthase [Pseudomonadota bacterium]